MKRSVWIRNVEYFTRHLILAILCFNKNKIAHYWDWLKEYFNKDNLKK